MPFSLTGQEKEGLHGLGTVAEGPNQIWPAHLAAFDDSRWVDSQRLPEGSDPAASTVVEMGDQHLNGPARPPWNLGPVHLEGQSPNQGLGYPGVGGPRWYDEVGESAGESHWLDYRLTP